MKNIIIPDSKVEEVIELCRIVGCPPSLILDEMIKALKEKYNLD